MRQGFVRLSNSFPLYEVRSVRLSMRRSSVLSRNQAPRMILLLIRIWKRFESFSKLWDNPLLSIYYICFFMSIDRLSILFLYCMNFRFWSVSFWKEVGYGLGSSPYLVRRLVTLADLSDAHIIVELGAGEWQVTGHILEKKAKDARFIVIENDHEKFLELSWKYGEQCEVYEMSAAHIDTILDSGMADVIISTLPLGSISHPGVGHILEAAQWVLKKWWKFIQYQYVMANKKDVKKYFHIDHIYWEPRNIGPTFIYEAHKK